MRALAIGAFVLDGAAAIGFVAWMALSEGRVTPREAILLAALMVGFFSAFATLFLAEPDPAPTDATAQMILNGVARFDRLPDAGKREIREHFPPTAPIDEPSANPAHHLELLTQPRIDAGNVFSQLH